MALVTLIAAMLVCSGAPALLFLLNLQRYRRPRASTRGLPAVSVLIPARNEENNIAACLTAVLSSRFAKLEVLVLDDGSTDRTAEIVEAMAREEPRLRLGTATPLPAGWNGKQHACWLLAQEASAPLLLFLDADVRLEPEAISRCAAALRRARHRPALLSGFPRQVTVGWTERMLLPLINFVLLAYLPLGQMRKTLKPAYAAGCGQFLLVKREAYFESGGHAAIRSTRHDGLRLPQQLRSHGYATELVDLTDMAEVRMYDSPRAVWEGLVKNATEGIASPGRIVPITVLLFFGQVLPGALLGLLLLGYAGLKLTGGEVQIVDSALAGMAAAALLLAVLASYVPRLVAVRRFRQPLDSALLHPLGVAMLLGVQWYALARQTMGRPVAWRARSYQPESGEEMVGTAATKADPSASAPPPLRDDKANC